MTRIKVLNKEFIDTILEGIECGFSAHRGEERGFWPAVDVIEDDKGYLLKMDLPGYKEDEINIEVKKRVLYIKGTAGKESEEEVKYLLNERTEGAFERSFPLPEDADSERVTAKFADGLLTIRTEKREEEQPVKIKIG